MTLSQVVQVELSSTPRTALRERSFPHKLLNDSNPSSRGDGGENPARQNFRHVDYSPRKSQRLLL